MTIKTDHSSRFDKIALLVALLLVLISCSPSLPPADPARAAQLRNEGVRFEIRNDFAGAIHPYKEATRYDPENSSAYLKLAEFQEATEKPQAAFETYERALLHLPATHPDREWILYRSALLLAEKLGKAEIAQNRLGELNSAVWQNDLAGVIALHQNEPRPALKQFQRALKHDMPPDQSARIYFHVAQAYDRLGDEERSRQALLIAVPNATSRDLKEDIRRFFESMLAQ